LVASCLAVLAPGSHVANAAPWPEAAPVHATDFHGSMGFCAAHPDGVAELIRAHAMRAPVATLATSYSTDAGEIAVLEDDGTFFYSTLDGHPKLDLMAVSKAFYRTHGDDYDFLAIFLATGLTDWYGSPTATASAFVIRNPTQGIGLRIFDNGAQFDSPARLEAILGMNGLGLWPDDPFEDFPGATNHSYDAIGHEMGHRWLSYVRVDSAGSPITALLGRGLSHWSFFLDLGPSIMEGAEWEEQPADSFTITGVSTGFTQLDQYLMGLRAKAETDSFYVIDDASDFNPPGIYVPFSEPRVGIGCDGRKTWYGIDDIETVHGPRVPDAASAPHDFRVAFVLVTANGNAPTAADLAKLDTLRTGFVPYFATATEGRGTVNTTLDSQAGTVTIDHEPLKDTEDVTSSRPVAARIAIDQGGIPIALDPASIRVFWRLGTSGSYTAIAMMPAGNDSFTASLPAGTGVHQYYFSAASDSAGIDALDPPGGASAPHSFTAGPDGTPPTLAHAPVPMQSHARMPQHLLARVTDNLGVDSVWVEYAVDGGALQSIAASPAGRDSYVVALGGGLAQGQRLTYRIRARDAAVAGNSAISNPAFDTLVVGKDWFDDFENGTYGYFGGATLPTFRDPWHPTQETSSPAGGTAMKCGAVEAGGIYPPHVDAYIQGPTVHDIVPGTKLMLDHRYDLEQRDSVFAWDGARVEVLTSSNLEPLIPLGGYSHIVRSNANSLRAGTPCWSGNSGGWRTETFDLTAYAPGPISFRMRMATDNLFGGEGWFVDRIRLVYPPPPTGAELPGSAIRAGVPWPNPARGEALHLDLATGESADVEWALFDLAGRRVARLWQGRVEAGGFRLIGRLPDRLANGIYFARVLMGGRTLRTTRVAVMR
jgi:hypothetical protein